MQATLTQEFVTLGLIAGLWGGVLGSAATALILQHAAGVSVSTFDPTAILMITVIAAALAGLIGYLGSISLLRPKPFEILLRR